MEHLLEVEERIDVVPDRKEAARRAAGALLVFDEVITGLGRTGSLFALEREGVVPDVLLLAKAVGGGLPLGAFIASEELMSILSQDPPLGHVTTFGGHPLSCAAGLATLEVIVEDQLPARAATLGDYFADALTAAMQGDGLPEVRHAGLPLGLEMASPPLAEPFLAACLPALRLAFPFFLSLLSLLLRPPQARHLS